MSATYLLNQIDSALTATPTDSDKLSQLKLGLPKELATLKLLDLEILKLTPEEGLDEQADSYKENVYHALTMIDKLLNAAPSPSMPATDVCAPVHPRGNKVKLPQLSLPHFSRNVTKWTTFWDSYKSSIHNNDELTYIDKFNYLKSLLECNAYEVRGYIWPNFVIS